MIIRLFPVTVALAIALAGAIPKATYANVDPDKSVTPGHLCSGSDDDFDKWDYPEEIARCKRHVTKAEKTKVAREYDIPESEWSDYEFDHLIPLCAGGSNDMRNLWPQPLDEAHDKDTVENEVCRKMKAGTMTQKQAVRRIWDWFEERLARHQLAIGR